MCLEIALVLPHIYGCNIYREIGILKPYLVNCGVLVLCSSLSRKKVINLLGAYWSQNDLMVISEFFKFVPSFLSVSRVGREAE